MASRMSERSAALRPMGLRVEEVRSAAWRMNHRAGEGSVRILQPDSVVLKPQRGGTAERRASRQSRRSPGTHDMPPGPVAEPPSGARQKDVIRSHRLASPIKVRCVRFWTGCLRTILICGDRVRLSRPVGALDHEGYGTAGSRATLLRRLPFALLSRPRWGWCRPSPIQTAGTCSGQGCHSSSTNPFGGLLTPTPS